MCAGFSACSNANQSIAVAATNARILTPMAKARIDSMLNAVVANGSVAGASALVFENGREVYYNNFGMADREQKRAMSRNTIVQIFSMTKPITGVALMQLYEQGKFRLDDPLSKYAPEFANLRVYVGTNARGAPILANPTRTVTIRDITRHTAGFATGDDNPGVGPLLRAADPGSWSNTLTQFAQKLGAVPLWFDPGSRWEYGPSVDVQAFLVERLSGEKFGDYIQQHVLTPLRMNDTRYFVPESDRTRMAAVYQRTGTTIALDSNASTFNTNHWALTPGSYGLTSTVDDYMRFARMLVNGGELDGVRVLKSETVKLMTTSHLDDSVTSRSWLPSKGSVGFGIDFAVRTRPPQNAQENNGVVGEFFWDGAASTLFWVDPVNKLTAVLFVQIKPFDGIGLHKGFRDAVYGPYAR